MHTFILLGRCQAAEESEEARTVSELSPTATTHTALPGCDRLLFGGDDVSVLVGVGWKV